jgi:AcrR family transcriptional regulator
VSAVPRSTKQLPASGAPASGAPVRHAKTRNRRREIADEAAALFDEAGSTNPSMEDIANAVGIAKPTLYHYFTSKDEIVLEIHEAFIDLLLERHSERIRHHELDSKSLLLEAMADIFELMETHRGHVRVFFEYYRQLPDPHRSSIRAKRNLYFSMVEDIVRQGIKDGEFRDIDPTLATIAVFGLCNWSHLELSRVGGRLRAREFAQHFWDFIVRGFEARPAPRARHG